MEIKTFTYKRKKDGSFWPEGESDYQSMDTHIQRLMNAGWELMNSADDAGHVRLGKTLILTALTGGLNLLFGASRTAQTITLTFRRSSVPETPNDLGGVGRCAFCGTGLQSGFTMKAGVRCCAACAEKQDSRTVGTVEEATKQLNASGPPEAIAGPRSLAWTAGRLVYNARRHPGLTMFLCLVGLSVWWRLSIAGRAPEPLAVSPQVGQPKVRPVIDLPKLALRTRAEVERELGKPSRYIRKTMNELADEADYPWGVAGYNQSRLNFLILRFQTSPRDYEEAFALLNLPHPNPPYVAAGGDGTRQLFWRDRTYGTGYTCCENIAIQDIWISTDWKEMHVLILDLDDPETWLDQQCMMYVQRTGLPLPKGATWRGDPLRRPIVPKKKRSV